jgi:hypothetical protein
LIIRIKNYPLNLIIFNLYYYIIFCNIFTL